MSIESLNQFFRNTGTGPLRWRGIKDRFASVGMGVGGVSVIIAIILIFFYLLYVVFPMFIPAGMDRLSSYSRPASALGQTVHLALEEQNEVAVRLTDQGQVIFFRAKSGKIVDEVCLPLPGKAKVSAFAHGRLSAGLFAYGLDNGQVLVARYKFDVSYPDNRRKITPSVEYPLGMKPITVDKQRRAVQQLAIRRDEEQTSIVSLAEDGQLRLTHLQKDESDLSLDDEDARFEINTVTLPAIEAIQSLLIEYAQQYLYVTEQSGHVTVINISEKMEPQFVERKRVVAEGVQIKHMSFLTGGISILIATSTGEIGQWFPVRKGDSYELTRIRTFSMEDSGAIYDLETEQRRKGFVAANQQGRVEVYHSTAHRSIVSEKISEFGISHIAVSPRADRILAEASDHNMQFWHVENEHPEISWAVLWDKVWYESYPKPDYTWQSSSASNDFEPKYSLVPLAFGTLKAAFYAMLFAVPLAIMGAIYTAYFMAPQMRTYVKPAIEIMEALPTVILGFLAGLWLAPVIESHLAGVFSMLLIMPLGVLAFAYGWHRLPATFRNSIPDGWQAAVLIPVLLILGWFAMSASQPMEAMFFSGSLKVWLDQHLGIGYDQRNSMVVGIAMGVAVIPTIFSITEDAIFSVPKHLTYGSLALGATAWQTMIRVVLLTASPGIFSAVMIGLGRAVGETMIVLMATGNTPVMDFSIFQGMRTLSANIAVEMPESEVDSTHYRVLFLAALVLFVFTFLFNTSAEIIRHRLRKKYSSL